MSSTLIDISSKKLEDFNLNPGLERWMKATIFRLQEMLQKTYEKLVEYSEKEKTLEVYEKEVREVFLNVAGESIREFFNLRRYTGYEEREISCICGKEKMKFQGYREKEYISLASNIWIKRAYY